MYGGIAIRWSEMTTVVAVTKVHSQQRLAIECLSCPWQCVGMIPMAREEEKPGIESGGMVVYGDVFQLPFLSMAYFHAPSLSFYRGCL